MITRKELSYISGWPNRVPYPGDDYALEAMEKLRLAEILFKEIYENNKYNITFSNNEEIEMEIKSKNLSHILGIDFKSLSKDLFTEFRAKILNLSPNDYINSYTLLKAIIENSDKIVEHDRSNTSLKIINYYKISVKSDIFSKLGNLADFNFSCINFNKKEFLKNSNNSSYSANSTKYLYVPSDEPIAPYFLIGLLQAEPSDNNTNDTNTDIENDITIDNKDYIVETSLALENVKSFFQNQEVMIPTQILKDTNKELTKIQASASQKKALLKEYRSIITEYELNNRINIYSDYLSMLSQEEKVKNKNKSTL